MAIDNYKYESNAGGIYKIRLSAEKKAVSGNTEPAGAITDNNVQVMVSNKGRRRKAGIFPRGVTISRTLTAGTGATAVTKKVYAFIPCLTPAALTSIGSGSDVTYDGQTWKFSSTVPEV